MKFVYKHLIDGRLDIVDKISEKSITRLTFDHVWAALPISRCYDNKCIPAQARRKHAWSHSDRILLILPSPFTPTDMLCKLWAKAKL